MATKSFFRIEFLELKFFLFATKTSQYCNYSALNQNKKNGPKQLNTNKTLNSSKN